MVLPSPLFSVIIPTTGREQLAEAVRSVQRQTISDLECIVVDDGSEGRVAVPDDTRVRIVRRQIRGGAAAARNTGLEAASGRYVTFLDDDDLYTPDRLAIGLEGLVEARVSVCWMASIDDEAQPLSPMILDGQVHHLILERQIPHLGVVSVQREIVPRFDERFEVTEDKEWWLRLSAVAPVCTVPNIGYLQRATPGSLSVSLAKRLDGCLQLLEVHVDYFKAHPRAGAYQWRRAGMLAQNVGDFRLARHALVRSLRQRFSPGTVRLLLRSIRPSNRA